MIGNSLPRRCGIATFTTDLQRAISNSRPNLTTSIVAMTDHGQSYDYPNSVALQIKDDSIEAYVRAAAFLNAGRFDIACLQHEFGIFGGEAGCHILELLSRLTMPVVTTLHTVLAKPTAAQRAVMDRIVETSSKIVVMANKGRELLRSVYRVPDEKIEVIAHGIPDFPFVEPDAAKARLGFSGRSVILTFGLLSPSKGIEVMIDAMPSILKRRPDAVYVVLGATHPNLVRDQGEAYRESLMARVRALGVEDHVVFLDQFVDQATLLEFISMCDVYVTPYLNEAQMTSGTLAYSFGLGQAGGLDALLACARIAGRRTRRSRFLWRRGRNRQRHRAIAHRRTSPAGDARTGLCGQPADDVGAHRRALHDGVRERAAGPSVDRDRAHRSRAPSRRQLPRRRRCKPTIFCRCATIPACCSTPCIRCRIGCTAIAWMTMPAHCCWPAPSMSRASGPSTELLTARFAAFVQHAWNPDTGRFRNFMGYQPDLARRTGLRGQSWADLVGPR